MRKLSIPLYEAIRDSIPVVRELHGSKGPWRCNNDSCVRNGGNEEHYLSTSELMEMVENHYNKIDLNGRGNGR